MIETSPLQKLLATPSPNIGCSNSHDDVRRITACDPSPSKEDYASAGTSPSRNAAIVNSQGREPLVYFSAKESSPDGARVGHHSVAPTGLNSMARTSDQGFTPLAINFRPFGPASRCIILLEGEGDDLVSSGSIESGAEA
jgi:hypothetical protein